MYVAPDTIHYESCDGLPPNFDHFCRDLSWQHRLYRAGEGRRFPCPYNEELIEITKRHILGAASVDRQTHGFSTCAAPILKPQKRNLHPPFLMFIAKYDLCSFRSDVRVKGIPIEGSPSSNGCCWDRNSSSGPRDVSLFLKRRTRESRRDSPKIAGRDFGIVFKRVALG